MPENHTRKVNRLFSLLPNRSWLAHSTRTGVATAASLAVAHLFRMREVYWAPVTTLIVMQSTLGASWAISHRRMIGTALGAALGAALASFFDREMVAYAGGIFGLGLICALLRLDQSAYRFAGIALTIVMLPAGEQAPWITGIHRFVEVSVGIAVGLLFATIWPREEFQNGQNPTSMPK